MLGIIIKNNKKYLKLNRYQLLPNNDVQYINTKKLDYVQRYSVKKKKRILIIIDKVQNTQMQCIQNMPYQIIL